MIRHHDAPAIGLVGCGAWGSLILRDLRELGCDVHVVAHSARSAANARDGGAASVVAAIEDLPSVDGVVVATPTSEHARSVEAALEHGVPVFVEKPLASTVEGASRIAAIGGDRLFVMDKWRYHQGVLELARIVRSGELGPLDSITARRVSPFRPHPDVEAHWTLLPHDLAIVLELIGELPPVVFASGERARGERVSLTTTLHGAATQGEAGVRGPVTVTVETSCVAPAHRRELRAVFSQGAVALDGAYADHLVIMRDSAREADVEHRPIGGEMPLLEELRAFVGYLDGGEAPRSSAAEGLVVVRRIEEAEAAADALEVATAVA